MREYGPVPEAHANRYGDIVNYCFRIQDSPFEDGDDAWLYPEMGARRGIFVDGELRAVCRHYFWQTLLRGVKRDTAALTVVGVPPEHRGKGYVTELTTQSLAEYRERGIDLAVLWPFDYGFYRRFGWGIANEYVTYEGPLDALVVDTPTESGSWARAEVADWRTLDRVYEAHAERFELALDRPEMWYRQRVFQLHNEPSHVYVWEQEETPKGYVVFSGNDDSRGGTVLDVRELVHVNRDALRASLRFLAGHDSQADAVRLYMPPMPSLLRIVDTPGNLTAERHSGPMVRIVDVKSALETHPYPRELDKTSFAISVDDPLVDENDGIFTVTIEKDTAHCRPVNAEPDVETDIATLSQLYVGARSIKDAVKTADIRMANDDIADVLATAFPVERVFFREDF